MASNHRWMVLLVAMLWTGAAGVGLVQDPGQPPPAGSDGPPEQRANAAIVPADRKEPWWTSRHEAFNQRARQGAEKGDINVIFLGDSITQGWEGEGRGAWDRVIGPLGAVNFGIGGDRTQHVLWRLENGNIEGLARPRAGAPPKLAVLMIGTNNTGSDTPEEIAAGVGAVVKMLREKLPTTKVLLLGIFPRSQKPDDLRARVLGTNRLIRTLADGRNVIWFDFGNRFLEIDGTISPEIMPDALHLSSAGYEIWAEAIGPRLDELAGTRAR